MVIFKANLKQRQFLLQLTIILITSLFSGYCLADVPDPLDPFAIFVDDAQSEIPLEDKDKTAQKLFQEGYNLMIQERPLEARSKFLLALKKDPKLLHAHIALAEYYLQNVGHFRLALRYAKRAEKIFYETYGKPPYRSLAVIQTHQVILSLLSNIRLNLDEYEAALEILDRYKKYGYRDPYWASSRAWILFKLQRYDEALLVARTGLLTTHNKGALLNIIGILLSSMEQKEESLQVFKEAYQNEINLGSLGDPTTPLNNSGEVYREIFDEQNARRNWEHATLIHDFCNHILLSVNIATLNIEELKFDKAKQNLINFRKCLAQFPLKNEEEFKSLENMIRGRIALHTGDVNGAVKSLKAATKEKQFFGKIGTSQDDMQVASLSSYAQALMAKNNHLKYHLSTNLKQSLSQTLERIDNYLKSRWLQRRARQILMEKLNDFEDLYIRHTDSMLEYPFLGSLFKTLPTKTLKEKIKQLQKTDRRKNAKIYYDVYLAENLLYHGRKQQANNILNNALESIRSPFDDALKAKILILKMQLIKLGAEDYIKLANQLFALSRSELLNFGLRLPVKVNVKNAEINKYLSQSIFYETEQSTPKCKISYSFENIQHNLNFSCTDGSIPNIITVQDKDLRKALNKLTLAVFKRKI